MCLFLSDSDDNEHKIDDVTAESASMAESGAKDTALAVTAESETTKDQPKVVLQPFSATKGTGSFKPITVVTTLSKTKCSPELSLRSLRISPLNAEHKKVIIETRNYHMIGMYFAIKHCIPVP